MIIEQWILNTIRSFIHSCTYSFLHYKSAWLSFISIAHNTIYACNLEMAKHRHVGFQILTVMAMKFQVFLHVSSCWLINNFKLFWEVGCWIKVLDYLYPEVESSKLLSSTGEHLLINITSYPRKLVSSKACSFLSP